MSDDFFVWALAALAFLLLVLWRRAASRTRRGNMRRGRRARRLEAQAERLLKRQGFVIVDRQVTLNWPMEVDGDLVQARLRLDLVVERGGLVYVAEVKSGSAVRATAPETRRQLLEYRLACDVDGVLLVDMEAKQILEVRFPRLWADE
jgi:Holliday junction resolvase-like predicted endonuclease